jgi:Holliday junction resolvase
MHRRRDANECDIVDALELAGCRVYRIECRDKPGCPDLVVFRNGSVWAMEVKTENGDVSEAQHIAGVYIVRGVIQALRIVNGVKK